MPGDERLSLPDPIVYIDRSEIREGRAEELKAGIRGLVEFVQTHEPQLIAYGFYLDQEASQMSVVAVHPDSASLEFHIDIAGSEFRKLAHLITLQAIEVYGRLSDKARDLLRQKAAMLETLGALWCTNDTQGSCTSYPLPETMPTPSKPIFPDGAQRLASLALLPEFADAAP